MKKHIYLFLASLAIISLSSCEDTILDPLDTSYASFVSSTMNIGVETGSETSTEIKVYTTNTTNADRTISILVVSESTDADPSAYTVPSTVTIPAGTNVGSIMIDVKDVNLDEDKVLALRLEESEDLYTGEVLSIALYQLCSAGYTELKVNVTFDAYPEEGAWRLKDADGNTIMASADPFAYGGHTGESGTLTFKDCLTSGTYTLQVYDQYGDGGTAYTVTADGVLVASIAGDDYVSSAAVDFSF